MVISPIPWVPEWLWWRKRWNDYRNILKEECYDGITVLRPRYFRAPGGKWVYPWEGLSIYMGCKSLVASLHSRFKIDIIHAHRIIPDGYAAILLGKKLNIPVVCSARGGETYQVPFENHFCYLSFKKVLGTCDKIVTVSSALRDIVINTGCKYPVDVIYNGCDIDTFHYIDQLEARKKLNLPLNGKFLLFVGSIIVQKGVLELVKAFQHLKKTDSTTFLIMIGNGHDTLKIKEEIKTRNLDESVLLRGYIRQQNLPLWINASDIFVFPSYQEGLPNAVLEAMACRKPVIATRVGGIPEIINDGATGILVAPQNVRQLAEAMQNLINNEYLCSKLGVAGERLVHEQFTWEKSANKIIKIYRDLLENRYEDFARS